MDRLKATSTLPTVVDAGSLSAAAHRHNTPLHTVSRKTSGRGAQPGAKLFNRSSRKRIAQATVESSRRDVRVHQTMLADNYSSTVVRKNSIICSLNINAVPTAARLVNGTSLLLRSNLT